MGTLYASIRTSPPHPASWIDRLSPDLALAPFGSKPPSHRGRGAGRRTTRANRQVLDHDQVVVVDQLARELVGEVASLVAHPAMVLRCPILPTSSALGAPLLGRQVPLRSGEPSRGLSFQARTIDELSLGGGNQVHDPEVDPHLTSRRGERHRFDLDAADRNEPAVPLALDRDRLGDAPDLSVQEDLDVTDPAKGHAPSIGLQPPAACVLPLQRVEPRARLEPREPGRLATSAAPIEGAEHAFQPLESPSTDRDAAVQGLGAHLTELSKRPALMDVVDGSALPGPRAPAVFECRVVELALQPERHLEPLGLLHSRAEPIAEGPTLAHRISVRVGCDTVKVTHYPSLRTTMPGGRLRVVAEGVP